MIKIKKFGFFNSVNGDRKYLASDISNALNVAIGTGLAPIEDNFKIVSYENMKIKMKQGGCMIYGCYCFDDEEEIIQLDTANSELNRIDRVVLRWDKFERNIKTVVIKGTPALNPTPPASLKTENQFDLVLADVRVDKAITEIKQINDMRDSDLCGYLGGKVLEKNIFGAIQSLNTTGYRKLPGGKIEQWGVYKTPAGGTNQIDKGVYYKTITGLALPIAFPNKIGPVIVTTNNARCWGYGAHNNLNSINIGCSNIINADTNVNIELNWRVTGY
ncbi:MULTISPECIES: gp53-like domain-containing protein [Clostridium]|uniref:gp53-like domain-containing protein n=1 Tax=Clostridium TaxID=1485 RepID=UPI000773E08F|nr:MULTISPECIES: hypothetical protein [Clostridium]AUM96142.1 hypothetical protein RSJ11_13675 [Clostridium sporogenes]AVQ53593.1 hypothetical protein C7M59_12290 [Clostridium botulinum]